MPPVKKLLWIFAALCLVAVISATAGILFARRGGAAIGAKPLVLTWRISGNVVEQTQPQLFPVPGFEPPPSIAYLYRTLSAARQDARVKGLAVYIEDAAMGLAKAQELRRQIELLRQAGKFATCYLETAGEGANGTLDYYLATACEDLWLAPTGEVNLLGLYADSFFLRGTLDKLKIEPAFRHIGQYKSASEIFTEYEHSPAAQEAIAAVLESDFDQIVGAVARARSLEPAAVERLVDGAPYPAEQALELGLVDRLAYPDGFRDDLESRAGGEPRLVKLEDYRPRRLRRGRKLAVVFAEGTVVRGTGGVQPWTEEAFLGAADLGELLRKLAEDDGIAAVVLRVNSPGGSALASDLILREVEKLEEKKPVVVSMSDLAASGGYYIAAKATKIVAEGGTLTGSIGVVGGKLVTRRFQEELLGITHDPLKRGRNADLYSSLAGFTAEQAALYEEQMRRVYDTFLGHVATGRGMKREEVAAVAEGRVWTGADAHRLGLVDELGGLDRALELAREAAKLEPGARYQVEYYPEAPGLLEVLLGRREPALPAELRSWIGLLLPRAPEVLELPSELQVLARPF
jgi:protease-4